MQIEASQRQYSILFVDDEPRITAALKAIFRRDYVVHIANSGEDALSILDQTNIDVVVSDQRMPGMLGNELLALVSKRFPRTMRILLTGFTDRAAIVDSINEGEIYRFISKPWRNEELKELVADAALASEVPTISLGEIDNRQDVAPPRSPATSAQQDRAVLLIEHSAEVRNDIRRVTKDLSMMIYATQNIEQAVVAGVKRSSIGVAIVELSQNPGQALEVIHALKRARPDLITIALAKEYDAQIAIDLINQGQVYKYLTTPINSDQIANDISQGFEKHLLLKTDLRAQLRHSVDTKPGRIVTGMRELFTKLIGTSTSLSPSNSS